MYVSNFDLNFLRVILICDVNMHDFFQIFSQCLNLNLGLKAHGDVQMCMSSDLCPHRQGRMSGADLAAWAGAETFLTEPARQMIRRQRVRRDSCGDP